MTTDAHPYSEAHFANLRSFYSEGEVIGLMAPSVLFNYYNRLHDFLQMEPTKPATPEELAHLTRPRNFVAYQPAVLRV